MKKISYRISLGGIAAAICLLLMFFTAVFPILNVALPLFAGTLLAVVAIEINPGWGFVTYAAVACLSLFITPDKDAVIIFIMFFGYYPVLKFLLEKIISKVLQWIIKLAVFNAAIIASYYIMINVTGTIDLVDEFDFLKEYIVPVLLLGGNGIFVFYDYTVSTMVTCYLKWFRPTFLNKIK